MARNRRDEPEEDVEELDEDTKTDTKNDDDTDDTLLAKIIEITGLEREEDEKAEAFKERIVRHFADKYPNTKEGNGDFAELPAEVTDWVDAATEVTRANRGARNKKALPELGGLEEDEKPARRSRAKDDGEKEPKPKRERKGNPNAFGGPKALAEKLGVGGEESKVSRRIRKPLVEAGFVREKEPAKSGHVVFRHKDGTEVIVGSGKGENKYLLGWQVVGTDKHSYGADALQEYLKSR
ncbi:MAG: hypothetical protein KGO96_10355 [Elusimicrobia bacterium]|nr:hypothetical protein [Elusimicrobiota bacterium]